MSIRSIVTNPDKLARESLPVKTPEICIAICQDLMDTANHWLASPGGCLGLAAPQLGMLSRIIVIRYGGQFMPMVNPSWEAASKHTDKKREGCLSVAGNSLVRRYKKINVTFNTPEGEVIRHKFTGMTARVIQHEVDHLDGVTI